MKTGAPFRQRLRAARAILFGKGDDGVVCSFCGKDRHEAGCSIIAGPGVAICAECALLAADWSFIGAIKLRENHVGDTFRIFEHLAVVLPSQRGRIEAELERCAEALSSRLMGWAYACGRGIHGDGIAVYIEIPKEADVEAYRESFRQAFLSPLPTTSGGQVLDHVQVDDLRQ